MLFGALLAGAFGDIIGRRRVMLTAYAWFSVGMAVTAFMTTTTTFGMFRFVTGLGMGALIATTGALVAEIAPPGKKNLCSAISYCGVPLGSLIGSFLAIVLLDSIGWRGLFLVGALPLVTLLPLAFWKLPESVSWLVAKGQIDKARAVSERTGLPMPDSVPQQEAKAEKVGFAGLFSRGFWFATVVTGLMSALAQGLNYFLNTWLPVLMEQAGFNAKGSLAFLLVLSGGAIVGALAASRFADRLGPKPVVAICFLIGGVFISLMTLELPLPVRLAVRCRCRPGHHRDITVDLRVGGEPVPDQDAGCGGRVGRGLRSTGRGQRPPAGRFRVGRWPIGGQHLLHPHRPRSRGRRPDVAGPARPPGERHPLHTHRTSSTGRERHTSRLPDHIAPAMDMEMRAASRPASNPLERAESEMYDRILVAIDVSPDSPDDSLERLTQFATMAGGRSICCTSRAATSSRTTSTPGLVSASSMAKMT